MTDSFFTSRNHLDEQMVQLPPIVAEQFIEASVRRIVKVEGPLEAAKRLQRLADICAGAYVLPIDHWKSLGKSSAPHTAPAPKSRKEKIIELVAAHGYWFAAGMLFSMALSAFQLWVSG